MEISKKPYINGRLLLSYLLFLILLCLYYALTMADSPFMTRSSVHITLSFICYVIFSLQLAKQVLINNFTNLSFFFNSVWFLSLSMALLSLSNVQYDMTYDFLLYLASFLVAFNVGYYISSKYNEKNNKSKTGIFAVNDIEKDVLLFDSNIFRLFLLLMLIMCAAGYMYEIYSIGFIPMLKAEDEGFFDNSAGFLNIIHYFSTTLGAIAGMALALFFIAKSKIFYFIVFAISFALAFSLLTKNILFLTVFFFLAFYAYYKQISLRQIIFFLISLTGIMLLSSSIRLSGNDYMLSYSRIENDHLPVIIHWINTYFAINITHLNSYFTDGYTSTHGYFIILPLLSITFLKNYFSDNLIGEQIILFNGLGGNINVTPLFFGYMADIGYFGSVVLLIIGLFSGFINYKYHLKSGYVYVLIFAGLSYALTLSVFGDFINRIMVHVAIVILLIPYFITTTILKIKI